MSVTAETSPIDVAAFAGGGHTVEPAILGVIETLTPLHPRGLGRTNLTLIAPTIVQTDVDVVPFAGFQLVAGRRAGAVAMHVEPGAYGRTPGEELRLAFAVETDGPCAFSWQAGFDADQRTGTATVNGHGVVGMSLGSYTGGAIGLANIQQTGGTTWRWTRLVISHPFVLQPQL